MGAEQFAGQTVVISGAAGGLGRALCRRFAAAGANIAALDRDAAALEELAAQLKAEGHAVMPLACDITDHHACRRAIAAATAAFGGIDVLINNAGISHRSAFAATDPAVIGQVMAVNFFGAVHCTHAALPAITARRGLIIAVSSVAGFSPLIGRTGYAASKHALHGFFDSLRSEVEDRGVGVLLVCPAFIRTGIEHSALGGDGKPVAAARQTVGGAAEPEEVAERIFLAACRRERLLLPDATARLAWWVSRLAPRLFATLMKRRLGAEFAD